MIAEVLVRRSVDWIPVLYFAVDGFDAAAKWIDWCPRDNVRVLCRKGLQVLFRGEVVLRLVDRAQRICLDARKKCALKLFGKRVCSAAFP